MSESPQEFLKIQRIHAEMTFFRGNDNILHMLFNAHEGSGFDIVIPAVGYKILDCRPCSRKELHLIENDQRFPFMQRYIIVIWKVQEECIQVFEVGYEKVRDFFADTVEVDHDIGLVLSLRKFLYYIALPYTTSPIDQQCCLSVFFPFPSYHICIDLSFHCTNLPNPRF